MKSPRCLQGTPTKGRWLCTCRVQRDVSARLVFCLVCVSNNTRQVAIMITLSYEKHTYVLLATAWNCIETRTNNGS